MKSPRAAGSETTNNPTMSETTDINGDPIKPNKQYRLDFATGEMIPVEDE